MDLEAGTQLGRYEIRSKIAAGGMGEVYLAYDGRLERTVALKILPAEVASDQGRMRRFGQEARAASSLNHPNVAHIYEIEESGGYHFIAMEYVEGRTLRQHMAHRQLELPETLEIGMQVAAALSAAHAMGIVHRDIKPENIMVRNDGYIKVLDFGVAKLTDRPATTDTEAPTKALVNTDPGAVMGTVGYMSPEQARGIVVDVRTDIWSLGVVLYEMLAGRAPFEAATAGDVISSILGKEPPLLARYVRDVPEAMEWIITKALTKDREERYQTAREMLVDLRRLKQRLELAVEMERSTPPNALSREMVTGTGSSGTIIDTTPKQIAETQQRLPPSTASSAEYLVGEIKSHKTGVVVAAAALGLALLIFAIVGGIVVYKLSSRSDPAKSALPGNGSRNMKISRLTVNGKAENAAISPDGKMVVYVVREGGQRSLWMRQVATSSNVQIVAPSESFIGRQTFSPDGNYIYFYGQDKENLKGALFQVPTLGGTPRRILTDIGGPISFSPDGSRIAFVRNDNAGSGEDQLMIANADGTDERKLTMRKGDKFFGYGGLGWSPDGKVIASSAGTYSGGFHFTIVVIDAGTGEQKEITSRKFVDAGRISWLADGSGMLVNVIDQGQTQNQIWLIDYPSGEAHPITRDLSDYGGTSLSADSKSLVTVQFEGTSNVAVGPVNDIGRARQITSGKREGYAGLAWTPDNRIVYSSMASGNLDLWIMNADGTNQKQLTADPERDLAPAVSPDGRYVVFNSHRAGFPSLWRMDIDGGNLKQLTFNQEDYNADVTPDGRWVVFCSWRTGRQTPWKISIDGGDAVQIADLFIANATVSADGKMLICFLRDDKPNSPLRLILLPYEGGTPIKTFDMPPTVTTESPPILAPDSKTVIVRDTRTGTSNLWSVPLDGSNMKQLTEFKPDFVWNSGWSRDGKSVALSRGAGTSDVILISDFR